MVKRISLLTLVIFIISCNKHKQLDIKYKSNMKCLTNIEKQILLNEKILDFSKHINCFEWDSLKIENLNNFDLRKYFDFKFKVVNDSIRKRMEDKGLVFQADEESWSYIFFYSKGTILNDALAIHNHDLFLSTFGVSKKISRQDAIFLVEYRENSLSGLHFKDSTIRKKYTDY